MISLGSIAPMNSNHDRVCPSPEWADYMQSEVLPAVTTGIELGALMLEIGPGPGATTEWLRHRVARLVALELDPVAADRLTGRFADTNVEVRVGDATEIPWPDGSFDSVGCFTMLHHVPTAALQNRILSEAHRVLGPGGTLLASDSLATDALHHFHEGDTYNPVDPGTLLTRLQTVGFDYITVSVDYALSFRARKGPGPDARDGA
jgi:SAM-dependent methyltransferase